MTPSYFPRTRHRPHPLTVALLLAGWAVLIFGTNAMHMRPDEQLTFTNMQYSFAESMELLATGNNQAPLWWMNTWAWQRLAGLTEFANRANSALISMLTLAVVYATGRDWFEGRRAGWYALALLGTSAYFFIYALEMRMYPLVMLTAALSSRLFATWTREKTGRFAVLYGLSAALMLYVHYYTAFVVIVHALFFLILHIRNGRLVRQGIVAGLVALVAWSPGALIMYGQLRLIEFGDESGLRIPVEPANWETALELAQITTNGLWVLVAVLLAVGVWRSNHRRLLLLALFWWIGGAAIVMLLNIPLEVYTRRYVAWVAPGAALAIAGAAAALPRRAGMAVVVGLVGLGVFGGAGDLNNICQTLDNIQPRCAFWRVGVTEYVLDQRTQYRPVLREVAADYQPGDILFVGADMTPFDGDQLTRYLPPALLDAQTRRPADAVGAARVWFVSKRPVGDVRDQFDAIEASHRLSRVIGECSGRRCFLAQLLEAPPNREPLVFGEGVAFYGAGDRSLADGAMEVVLWWAAAEPVDVDYSVALQVLDENGNLIAGADGPITTPDGEIVGTSALPTDGFTLDTRRVQLPAGLAAGAYPVQVVVYQWWDGERLLTKDGPDAVPLAPVVISPSDEKPDD